MDPNYNKEYKIKLTSPGLSIPDTDEFIIEREEYFMFSALLQTLGYDFNTLRKTKK